MLEGASVREQYTIDTLGNLTDTHDGRLLYTDPSRPYAATELDGPGGGTEHEEEIGLVNMGGRIYSPRLRRFLTADPIVATPFGQGLNASRWAPRVGAHTCWDIFENTTNMRELGSRLLRLMEQAGEIHFNLDDLITEGVSARNVLEWGAEGIGQGNVTNWEFYQVVTQFSDRAVFHLGGRVVTLAELGL
ncbi:MAG: hypothetical protein U0353_18695 [Sandaracinus sp.]